MNLSGPIIFILIVAVLLAVAVAWVVAWLYQRRMLSLMRGAAPLLHAGATPWTCRPTNAPIPG
jgi:hypothetical protein